MSSMSNMVPTWSLSPLWLPGIILIVIEELGLRRLRPRCSLARSTTWRYRGWAYEAGIVVICVMDSSPLMGLGMKHLTVHMVMHVVEMFYIPIVLILGAPWLPALFALPVAPRRRLLRWWRFGSWRGVTMGATNLVTAPLFAIIAFNVTMVTWHLPVVFNWAGRNMWTHTWLMTPSFVIVGYLFWRLLIGSHPFGPRASIKLQIVAVVVTAFEMLVLAIAMSVMSHTAWYTMNIEMLGSTQALHDQQLAAGILWVCGDFWAAPALVLIAKRVIDQHGSMSQAFESSLGRI